MTFPSVPPAAESWSQANRSSSAQAPFLVTGAGRCGTHYLCEALNLLGFLTGHEQVFGYDESSAGRWGRWRGDCSWPGAAYLHRVPAGTAVLHLVRDPLAMVRSRLGDNNLGASAQGRTVASFVVRHRTGIFDGAVDDLGRALLFVERWNRAIESHARSTWFGYRRERIEDVSRDPLVMSEVVSFLTGAAPSPRRCSAVQADLDELVGSRGHSVRLDWEDVVGHPNGAALAQMSWDYGYRSVGPAVSQRGRL